MSNLDLNGQQILFIAPRFFGYEKHIADAMTARGAAVHFCSDNPSENAWGKAALRLFPKLAWIFADRIHRAWLDRIELHHCDVVFIVKGEAVSPAFLNLLHQRYPRARFVLYLYDSIANVKHTDKKLASFDSVFSFDPADCKSYPAMRYRPLFFINQYRNNGREQSACGLFFFGTLNGDRPKVLARIIGELHKDIRFDFGLYVRSKIELVLRRLTDSSIGQIRSDRFVYKAMPADEIMRRMTACNCVLDIEHPKQTGLTMRTFEVLASGKKLITTNQSVRDAPFFDASNICVIDRMNPVIPKDFVHGPCKPMPPSFFENYSLESWLGDVLRDPLK